MVASGELGIDPVGVALKAAPFPDSGERGGPTVKLRVQNITPVPMRVSLRLLGLPASLDDAATVRGSAAGAVLIDGPLKDAGGWSLPAGLLSSGETTTLRLRFKLKKGLADDAYRGRIDIRQLELKGTPLKAPQPAATTPTTPAAETPTTPTGSTSGSTGRPKLDPALED